jgi:hypothetical protein
MTGGRKPEWNNRPPQHRHEESRQIRETSLIESIVLDQFQTTAIDATASFMRLERITAIHPLLKFKLGPRKPWAFAPGVSA